MFGLKKRKIDSKLELVISEFEEVKLHKEGRWVTARILMHKDVNWYIFEFDLNGFDQHIVQRALANISYYLRTHKLGD